MLLLVTVHWTELLLTEIGVTGLFLWFSIVDTMAWISTFAINKISTDGSLDAFQWIRFVILFWFHARWKENVQGACWSPRLQYLRDYGVLQLLTDNPWISLCHPQIYVLLWNSSSLLYLFAVCSSSVMFAYVSQWRHRHRSK